jgi:hypothetical protein
MTGKTVTTKVLIRGSGTLAAQKARAHYLPKQTYGVPYNQIGGTPWVGVSYAENEGRVPAVVFCQMKFSRVLKVCKMVCRRKYLL